MLNRTLKDFVVSRILPERPDPGAVRRRRAEQHPQGPPRPSEGTVCLAFPDTYALGMSHHGLQVLYSLMNAARLGLRAGVHPPARLRDGASASMTSRSTALETFTPLNQFDVLGFSLQYEICYTNVLTMLDLGGIPLHAEDRGPDDTLVIAGGPGAQNPELLAPFIDLFVIGDGEPSLPVVCDLWKAMQGDPTLSRDDKLARIAGSVNWAYVPRFYEPSTRDDGTIADDRAGLRDDVPAAIKPA